MSTKKGAPAEASTPKDQKDRNKDTDNSLIIKAIILAVFYFLMKGLVL